VLTLTGQAVEAIRSLTSEPGLPPDTGLRIAPEGSDQPSLRLSLAQGPETGDAVIEDSGVRVFVQSEAAPILDDKALDAQVNDEGQVSFLLAQQPA
jgi:Fe-S cluster assembly iron-binding protein IscA